MKRGVIIALIVVLTIIVIGLSSFFGFLLVKRNGFMIWRDDMENGAYIVQKEEQIDLADCKDLEFRFTDSKINIITTQDSELKVVQKSTRTLNRDELFTVSKENGQIVIKEREKEIVVFPGIFNWKRRIEFDVFIPETYAENLIVRNVAGKIYIQNDLKVKNITLKETSGKIETANISSNDITVKSTSGKISMENITCANLDITNTSGKIELAKVECSNRASFNNVSGGIDIQVLNASDSNLNTTSGSIEIANELAGTSHKINSVSGSIRLSKATGKLSIETMSSKIAISLFDITGDSYLKTISGSVEVNTKQACRVTTDTVSGSVRLSNADSGDYKMSIKTMSGSIRVNQ